MLGCFYACANVPLQALMESEGWRKCCRLPCVNAEIGSGFDLPVVTLSRHL